jgi:hypothetical protein
MKPVLLFRPPSDILFFPKRRSQYPADVCLNETTKPCSPHNLAIDKHLPGYADRKEVPISHQRERLLRTRFLDEVGKPVLAELFPTQKNLQLGLNKKASTSFNEDNGKSAMNRNSPSIVSLSVMDEISF